MKTIDLSVIIPVYNVEAYVEACLCSVMEQEHVGFEVECIIVDDRGRDGSMNVVRRTLDTYKGDIEFKIIEHDENHGLSAARNTAIREARGKYVTFLDSDDRLLPGALAGMYQLTVKYPGVDIVQGEVQLDKPAKWLGRYFNVSSAELPECITDRSTAKRIILFEIPVTAWAKLIRREFITDNNLYYVEGMIHEDDMWDLCASQYIECIAFYFTPVYYYNNYIANSIMGNPDKTRSFVAKMMIIEKATELFAHNPCQYYYDYILWKLEISNKIALWADVSDKMIAKKAIDGMRKAVKDTKCFPLNMAACYFSLPPVICNNQIIAPICRRLVRKYSNFYSQKTVSNDSEDFSHSSGL